MEKGEEQQAFSSVPGQAEERTETQHVDISRLDQAAGIEIVYQESSGENCGVSFRAYYGCGFVSGYLDQVELPGIFGRKRKAGILRCSEIAAHAFAKELTGLAVLPNYFDYAYLMSEGKLKEEFLDKARQLETLLRQSG